MAQQVGTIKLKGKVGDLSFYERNNIYQARAKGGVDAKRIKNDIAFERTRENNSEFAKASQAAKKLRQLFRIILLQVPDPKMNFNLTSRFLRIVKADQINNRGSRNVLAENYRLLQNFQFNSNNHLYNTFLEDIASSINLVDQYVEIKIPAIHPKISIVAPGEVTHFRLITSAASIGTENECASLLDSEILNINDATESQTFKINLVLKAHEPIIILFGITFFTTSLNCVVPLQNGDLNTLGVIKIY
ncbi:hypothetical protein GCM10022246_03440 [Pedobacter ginsengiterrae]|uniref:Uncharacterized protein n=1 Tax=Pedobacter ginsengiterrae TaxID=871696 RepID=A0ABP7NR70_9SPHI